VNLPVICGQNNCYLDERITSLAKSV